MSVSSEPTKIGKYSILGVAGRGNMGVVYAGHDPYTDQKVAIKVCSLEGQDERESRVTKKLFFDEEPRFRIYPEG